MMSRWRDVTDWNETEMGRNMDSGWFRDTLRDFEICKRGRTMDFGGIVTAYVCARERAPCDCIKGVIALMAGPVSWRRNGRSGKAESTIARRQSSSMRCLYTLRSQHNKSCRSSKPVLQIPSAEFQACTPRCVEFGRTKTIAHQGYRGDV